MNNTGWVRSPEQKTSWDVSCPLWTIISTAPEPRIPLVDNDVSGMKTLHVLMHWECDSIIPQNIFCNLMFLFVFI